MKKIDPSEFPGVHFGEGAEILAEQAYIKPGASIGNGVKIEAKLVSIGYDSVIERETSIRGLGRKMDAFILGDNCFIGFRNQILAPEFVMMDYSQLHNSGLHSGYKPLRIGYNCWIGQSSILNCTEMLTIENNVRIGTQSQLWTHVASGELLEGCSLYGNKELTLKDNVWIVGGAVISPGLVLERNSIVMTGSVLTKSTEPFHTYAGVPARDQTDKLNFWKETSIGEKMEMLKSFAEEFYELFPHHRGRLIFQDNAKAEDHEEQLYFFKKLNLADVSESKGSYFDLETKTYTKRRSKIEIDWIKFHIGFRARFIPVLKK